jgi:prepilin-type processing-associated H-X9-DG protein
MQPGGWVYNILPYMGQQGLWELGAGMPAAAKKDAAARVVSTPVEMFNCPSRRRVAAFVKNDSWGGAIVAYNANYTNRLVRTDYAINCGDQTINQYFGGPATLAEGDAPGYAWHDTSNLTGVSFERSLIKASNIRDGTSSTYLIGEKYLTPDHYETGNVGADNESMYTGFNNDNFRSVWRDAGNHVNSWTPVQDTPGFDSDFRFGSPHVGGCHFVMCDGSVQIISYSINDEMHRRLGNRDDGLPVDQSRVFQ